MNMIIVVNLQSLLPNLILSFHPYNKIHTEKENDSSAIRKVESIRHKTARKFDKWKLWSLKKTIENMTTENFENIKINKGRRKKE